MQAALRSAIQSSKHYSAVFARARASRSRVTSAYDISSTCNLFCEGCLFFDRDGGHAGAAERADIAHFEDLFAAEKARGVTYPLMAGAEPALRQDVLRVAARHFRGGMVHSNGTVRLDPALPFRIFISVWGGPALTKQWRGADCYEKSLRTAAADPRAIVNYTVNAKNIDDIYRVSEDCDRLGVQITFQAYSPTADYQDYLSDADGASHTYIQSGSAEDNLVLSADDDARAADAICTAVDAFPETVAFTKPLARYAFGRPGPFYDAEFVGAAPKHCLPARHPQHRHFQLGGIEETEKTCGHGNTECRTCRTYTTIYPGFFREMLNKPMTKDEAIDFLDAHEVFDVLYMGGRYSGGRLRTSLAPSSIEQLSAAE